MRTAENCVKPECKFSNLCHSFVEGKANLSFWDWVQTKCVVMSAKKIIRWRKGIHENEAKN